MSEPFLAEVKMFGFNFPPRGWAQCDGQILPINQNQSLFSLLGTVYGGDGRTSFALPDMRGRTPFHPNDATFNPVGKKSGEEDHFLDVAEIPNHTHVQKASNDTADQQFPAMGTTGRVLARSTATDPIWVAATAPLANMNADSVANTGGDQGHNNMSPYLAINFCIALQGLFPSRN